MGKKRGRPPKDPTGTKQARFEVRVAESEKTAMEAAAQAKGLTLSEWARKVLLRSAKR